MIGIDPGLSGALALIDNGVLREVADMPIMAKGKGTSLVKNEINPAALAVLLRRWVEGASAVRIVVELARAHAIKLYPSADLARKKDHNRGEALLIARWYIDSRVHVNGEPF